MNHRELPKHSLSLAIGRDPSDVISVIRGLAIVRVMDLRVSLRRSWPCCYGVEGDCGQSRYCPNVAIALMTYTSLTTLYDETTRIVPQNKKIMAMSGSKLLSMMHDCYSYSRFHCFQ